MTVFWIFLAGGLGSITRYLFGLAAARWLGTALPYGTLIVNVLGCFLIALTLQATTETLTAETRLVLAVGFLGGFTTYSSFNYDTLRFISEGAPAEAAAYFLMTTLGCALAGLAGLWLTR